MKVCGVRFKSTGKLYYFSYNDFDLEINDYVVVDTEKGNQYARVINNDITLFLPNSFYYSTYNY